ncbi:MAG TPA: hypothetical protein VJH75_02140 [Patescibacteria group bacterium]|nr:hypothetical protein [Patescibacteria group bacterium]
MVTISSGNRLIKTKIACLKNELNKEQERRNALLKELKQIQKMEKSVVAQNDKQSIAKIKQQILDN